MHPVHGNPRTGLLRLGTSPPLTEVSRALRARNAEKVSKMSPGASGPGTPKSVQKVPEHFKNTLQALSGDSPETCRTVPETFLRLFGVSGPGAPGDIFETFSAFQARRARETSVRGGLVPNSRNLLKTHKVLRSPFRGLCVKGAQNFPPTLVALWHSFNWKPLGVVLPHLPCDIFSLQGQS